MQYPRCIKLTLGPQKQAITRTLAFFGSMLWQQAPPPTSKAPLAFCPPLQDARFSTTLAGAGEVPISTKVILSSHDFEKTPSQEFLNTLARNMRAAGADIVKIATFANDITDAAKVRVLSVVLE